jgi:hypothetical protein
MAMKTNIGVRIAIAAMILAAIPMITDAQPRISFQLQLGAPPVRGYYVSLGESYDVPYQDICLMHEAGVVDEDIPLILYIYRHSQYSLRQIYSLRVRGASWEQLSSWCGVPLYRDRSGPPYGNAYGYYSHGPGKQWNGSRLSDGEGGGHNGKWLKGQRARGRFQEER